MTSPPHRTRIPSCAAKAAHAQKRRTYKELSQPVVLRVRGLSLLTLPALSGTLDRTVVLRAVLMLSGPMKPTRLRRTLRSRGRPAGVYFVDAATNSFNLLH